jgi:cell division protein FtsB
MPTPGQLKTLRTEMSSHHRRVISVRLRVLENYCRTLLEFLQPLDGTLTRRVALPEEKAAELQTLVAELNTRISRMHGELGLERATLDARRQAAALVSSMGVDLEELHPRYLKGYGEVPPILAEYLEARLGDCLDCVARMHRALEDVPAGAKSQKKP